MILNNRHNVLLQSEKTYRVTCITYPWYRLLDQKWEQKCTNYYFILLSKCILINIVWVRYTWGSGIPHAKSQPGLPLPSPELSEYLQKEKWRAVILCIRSKYFYWIIIMLLTGGRTRSPRAISFSLVVQCGFAKRTWHKHAALHRDTAARKII